MTQGLTYGFRGKKKKLEKKKKIYNQWIFEFTKDEIHILATLGIKSFALQWKFKIYASYMPFFSLAFSPPGNKPSLG